MEIKNVEFSISSPNISKCPNDTKPEYAFIGRSNVGKSSLINMLCNNKKLAKTSATPGKTLLINFFIVNKEWYLVDLPGYGYAKVSKSVSSDWGPMMEKYLSSRENLIKVIQLVDIRHAPSRQDVQMYEYLKYYGLDGIVAATKADKVSRNELSRNIAVIRKTLGMGKDDRVIPCSSLKRTGQDELLLEIEKLLEE